MTTKQATERDEARSELRALLEPSDTVYTVLRHVSPSGMMRVLDIFIMRDNRPRRITWTAAQAIGATYNRKREGLQMGGCGMDMGFAAVYELSIALFCPDTYSHDAAYALKHEWL